MATQGIWNIQQPDGYTCLKNRDYESLLSGKVL
jgi:hypothetical protein